MTKFFEEFKRLTNNRFPMLKLGRASYVQSERKLTVRFIISAFDLKAFDLEQRNEVKQVIASMFAGVETEVLYTPTFADKNVVKNKVLEFFNASNQMIFRRLSDDCLNIEITDDSINIQLRFDGATCKMLEAGEYPEKLTEWLDRNFNQDISVEIVISDDVSEPKEEYSVADSVVTREENLRLVGVKIGQKIYAKGKIETITQLPGYICDVKGECESITLCGRIGNVNVRMYKNKKYDPNNPKTGPEQKPIVTFTLNDTTGTMETICFPRVDELNAFDSLKDGDEAVCLGKVAVDSYKNTLTYTINAIFRSELDLASIRKAYSRPTPEFYSSVEPLPYSDMRQTSFIEKEDPKETAYFADKTFVVFDLETTSKHPSDADIIEIGAIKVENGTETYTFSTLVKPPQSIPSYATEINHITNEMVANAPDIGKVMPDFYKFTRGAILVGHNIERYDLPIVQRVAAEYGYAFDNELIDTLTLAYKLMPERSKFGLEAIARDMGFKHSQAHRALSDVEANLALFRELVRRMR